MSGQLNILNKIVDEYETDHTMDQCTIIASSTSLLSLTQVMLQIAQSQESATPGVVTLSTGVIEGLLDLVEWMNDRLQISKLDGGML